MLDNHEKVIFPLKRSFLGEIRQVKVNDAFQSKFKF